MSSTRTYERDLLDALSEGLRQRLGSLGRDPRTLGAPREVADRMLAVVPMAHPWDEQVGPFYDTPGVVRLLGISKQAVADRVRRRTLIATITTNGRHLYPTFQFDRARIVPRISEVAAVFRSTPADGWAIASWFTTPAVTLNGQTPAQWLRAGNDPDPVASLADDAAARWGR